MSPPGTTLGGTDQHPTSGKPPFLLETENVRRSKTDCYFSGNSQIEDKSDLYALLRAAPSLYNIIIPIWWKHLTINLRNDRYDDSKPTNIPLLLKARSPDLDRLQFVKGIVVKGTSPPLNWCIHRNRIYGKFFENMSKDIAKFLYHLKPNSLKQFM